MHTWQLINTLFNKGLKSIDRDRQRKLLSIRIYLHIFISMIHAYLSTALGVDGKELLTSVLAPTEAQFSIYEFTSTFSNMYQCKTKHNIYSLLALLLSHCIIYD